MGAWLHSYTEILFNVMFALLATCFALLLAVAFGAIIYALYKGATDAEWRK